MYPKSASLHPLLARDYASSLFRKSGTVYREYIDGKSFEVQQIRDSGRLEGKPVELYDGDDDLQHAKD